VTAVPRESERMHKDQEAGAYQVKKWTYRWFYNNVHSRYYDQLIAWCLLPFGGERRVRDGLIEDVGFRPVDRILDLCCGTGEATFAIARKAGAGVPITGLDLSDGQIRVARRKSRFPNVRFVVGDAGDTGLDEEVFNKVFITHALHEMFHNLRLKVLGEARRVLKNGGELVVLDVDDPPDIPRRLFAGLWFFYWLPFNFETPTRRDMFRRGLDNEVREAGFKDVRKISKHRGTFQVLRAIK
jgi:ubiquinone/menaquinone biosynthesis C-methylase UbiE